MSPSALEFKEKHPAFTMLLNAYFGYGKTYQAMTFPKVYAIGFDPSGLDILYQKGNEKLLANLVWYEYMAHKDEKDLAELFRETAKATEHTSFFGCLAHAEEMARDRAINTLLLDGFTYMVDAKWEQINEFETVKSVASGNVDTQAMYRNLGLYLARVYASRVLILATRYNLNVITTCHIKRESQDTVQGNDKTKNRARKVAIDSDIAPQIEGGFRNKVEGLVGASLYLDKKIGTDNKTRYLAYCDKTLAWGTVVNAKNRYGLPQVLELGNGNLYDSLMKSVNVNAPVGKSQ